MLRKLFVFGLLLALGLPTSLVSRSTAFAAIRGSSPLDLTFVPSAATPGVLVTPTDDRLDRPIVTPLPDGGFVLGRFRGDDVWLASVPLIERHLNDGTLDRTFGSNGIVYLPTIAQHIESLLVDSQGRIVVVQDGEISRYTPSGAIDSAFSTVIVGTTFAVFGNGTLDSRDRLLVNTSSVASREAAAIVRINKTGTFDRSFASSSIEPGFAFTSTTLMARMAPLVLVDDSVVLATNDRYPADIESTLTKLTVDGEPDAGFGLNGQASANGVIGTEVLTAGTVDASGNILLVGVDWSTGAPRHGYALRFNSSGVEDVRFRTRSLSSLRLLSIPRSVFVTNSGFVAIVGNLTNGATYGGTPAILMLSDAGHPATTFGWPSTVDGLTTIPEFDAAGPLVVGAAAASDGSLYLALVALEINSAPTSVARVVAPRQLPVAPGGTARRGDGFSPVVPVRLLDTRDGRGAPKGKLAGDAVLRLAVAGHGGVPAVGATAVTVNVTAVSPDQAGFATVFPCGIDPPNVSNLNYAAGQTVPNLVTVPLAADGTICISTSAATHVLADIAGWYGQVGDGFSPVVPVRLLDTRDGRGAPKGKLAGDAVLRLAVAGHGGVPAVGATAVTVNVTAVSPDQAGFATVFPCGIDPPNVSNLNYAAGQTVPNLVTVPLAADGTICISTSAATHVLADIAGWYG